MTTIKIIILAIFLLALLFAVSGLVTCCIPRLYNFVYNRAEWKLWEEYINRVDEFEFDNSLYLSYEFKNPQTNITAHVWKEDGLCSIHIDTKCLCCSFDKYHSKKMADLLMAKIKEDKS